jgi:hypothetical protein
MPQGLSPLMPLIMPFITGVVGFIGGWFLNERKRNGDAKYKFRTSVNTTFSKMNAAPFIFPFYKETKKELAAAVAEYSVYLEGAKKERLETLWSEYNSLTEEQLNGGYVATVCNQAEHGHHEEPQDVLKYYFERFLKI